MAKKVKAAQKGLILDNQEKICSAFRSGKKHVDLDGRLFKMRKITHKVKVTTHANPQGVFVLEHWLVVTTLNDDVGGPVGNIAYPHRGANSRADLV